jgi:hypothetical protein
MNYFRVKINDYLGLNVIGKPLINLFAIQRVVERKIATCLSTPGAGEFRNLV